MPVFSLDRERATYVVAHVENALIDGYPRPGHAKIGSHEKTATRVAAERIGVQDQVLRGWVGARGWKGSIFKHFPDLSVDWTLYKENLAAKLKPKETGPDAVDFRRLKDSNNALRSENVKLQRRLIAALDIRGEVLGIKDMPPVPVSFPKREKASGAAETIVLFLSDLQWGEVVSLDAMDGLNSYNAEIARKRLGRWANAVCELATKHWVGPQPNRIILILGGDLLSGAIHNELAKTDALKPLPAVRDVVDHLRAAILRIKAELPNIPIDVISLAGNHGRTTLKPESKEVVDTSLDTLVSDFLELALKGQKGISFFVPQSPDALFSVYGWRVLCTHGDRIGSRGGQGFVGPAATVGRGFKRLVADYAARGVHVDLILIGHFHTRMLLEEGFVNGSLVGPSEYARDGRFRPMPAQQLYIQIHPKRVFTQMRMIDVGDPSEGSLYVPPAPDRALRERFR